MNLLIEPYGIEIRNRLDYNLLHYVLLIEPYGIEIELEALNSDGVRAFNRTLWN